MSFGWGGRWIFRGNKGYFGFYTTKGKWKWRITSRSDQCRDRTVDEEGVQLVLHHVVRLQCWFAPFSTFVIHPRTLHLSMVSIVRYTNPRFSFPLLLFISTRAREIGWFSERLDLIVSVERRVDIKYFSGLVQMRPVRN